MLREIGSTCGFELFAVFGSKICVNMFWIVSISKVFQADLSGRDRRVPVQ